MIPGNKIMETAWIRPISATSSPNLSNNGPNPSTGIAIAKIETNIHGARKKMEENGFDVAGLRRRRICVRDHLNPDNAEAVRTNTKPIGINLASLATIKTTPSVMIDIIVTSFHVTFSRPKINAKTSTKANDEDLHMASKR
jgi:hypothetical protein